MCYTKKTTITRSLVFSRYLMKESWSIICSIIFYALCVIWLRLPYPKLCSHISSLLMPRSTLNIHSWVMFLLRKNIILTKFRFANLGRQAAVPLFVTLRELFLVHFGKTCTREFFHLIVFEKNLLVHVLVHSKPCH